MSTIEKDTGDHDGVKVDKGDGGVVAEVKKEKDHGHQGHCEGDLVLEFDGIHAFVLELTEFERVNKDVYGLGHLSANLFGKVFVDFFQVLQVLVLKLWVLIFVGLDVMRHAHGDILLSKVHLIITFESRFIIKI